MIPKKRLSPKGEGKGYKTPDKPSRPPSWHRDYLKEEDEGEMDERWSQGIFYDLAESTSLKLKQRRARPPRSMSTPPSRMGSTTRKQLWNCPSSGKRARSASVASTSAKRRRRRSRSRSLASVPLSVSSNLKTARAAAKDVWQKISRIHEYPCRQGFELNDKDQPIQGLAPLWGLVEQGTLLNFHEEVREEMGLQLGIKNQDVFKLKQGPIGIPVEEIGKGSSSPYQWTEIPYDSNANAFSWRKPNKDSKDQEVVSDIYFKVKGRSPAHAPMASESMEKGRSPVDEEMQEKRRKEAARAEEKRLN